MYAAERLRMRSMRSRLPQMKPPDAPRALLPEVMEDVNGVGREAVAFEGAATIGAENAGCVGVIDHEDGVVLFGEGDEFGQWGDVSVHREDAVGDDEATAMGGRGFELGFEVGDVAVVVDGDLCAGEATAINDAAVI